MGSITGGFVYRGAAIPELYGIWFGDLALRTPCASGRSPVLRRPSDWFDLRVLFAPVRRSSATRPQNPWLWRGRHGEAALVRTRRQTGREVVYKFASLRVTAKLSVTALISPGRSRVATASSDQQSEHDMGGCAELHGYQSRRHAH
jgi:hypothetical protein